MMESIWTDAYAEIAQVSAYADDLALRHPKLSIRPYIVYTLSGAGFRFSSLD